MNILIIRMSSLGDVVLTTPCVALLRKNYPQANIHFLVKQEFSQILKGNPNIDLIISFKKQKLKDFANTLNAKVNEYDLVIDLHNNQRSKLLLYHLNYKQLLKYKKPYLKRILLVWFKVNLFKDVKQTALQYMQALEPLNILPEKLPIFVQTKQPSQKLLNFSTLSENQKILCVAPGARWFNKKWPSDYFIEVIHNILESEPDYIVVFLGGSDEVSDGGLIKKELDSLGLKDRVTDLCGKLNLNESAFILSQSQVLLSNDSALVHIASAFDIRILSLYLSTMPEFGFYPYGDKSKYLSENLPCKPCNHKGLARCPKRHFKCAHLLSPTKVERELKLLL